MNFFAIFYYASGKDEKERKFLFFVFIIIFQPILTWNEAIMVFYNFLNFFAIFLEFSTTSRFGTDRNDNFLYLSFVAFSNLFRIEMKPQWCFFEFFSYFFGIFNYASGRNETERQFLFSLSLSAFSNLFWLEMKP